MWRVYFAIRNRQSNCWGDPSFFSQMTVSEKFIYDTCDAVFKDKFARTDQEILEMYYTTKWGDDLYAVDEYSAKNNIPHNVIWRIIIRAERLVIEEAKLLDRKEGGQRW